MRQWQKGEAALCPILSASLATRAKIKPVNKPAVHVLFQMIVI